MAQRGRPKKSSTKEKDLKQKKVIERKNCTCCGKLQNATTDYYQSFSILYKSNDKRLTVCKECLIEIFNGLTNQFNDPKVAVYYLCRLFDIFYDPSLYDSALQQSLLKKNKVVTIYMQKVNSLPQYTDRCFSQSILEDKVVVVPIKNEKKLQCDSEDDLKNKDDVLRLLGYDPFEYENEFDRKQLYNTLINYLDEGTLEDSFKIPAVIEIVKSFNQIDKINQAIALLTTDVAAIANQVGGVKGLMEAKDKMMRAILAFAKDNGISENNNNKKSKGAGTLSGIIKNLQEKGFSEININLFDIETSSGIRQVADMSNESIKRQLNFDENDYTEMINEQKEMIQKLDDKSMKLEEENRLLKIELLKYKNGGDTFGRK